MRVAVIIPCFNVKLHLQPCLDSVFKQSYSKIEVICVNDGSTDDTLSLLRAIEARGKILVIDQTNQGACAARNVGLAATTADYVQFLDADDTLQPEKIAHQVNAIFKAHTLPAVVVGNYVNVYPSGVTEQAEVYYNDDWAALIKTQMGTTSASLWSKEALIEVGGWNTALESSQDYELLFRLLKHGASVVYDRQALTHVFKRSSGSISQTNKRQNWLRYLELRSAIRSWLISQSDESLHNTIAICNQYLFMAVRVLSQYDMAEAVKAHQELIPKDFTPKPSKAITKQYMNLYRIFGFEITEKIIRLFKPHLYRRS